MLISSLVALVIGSVLRALNVNIKEDVFAPVMGISALLCWLISVFTAPWILQLILVAVPLIWIQMRIERI